MKHTISVNWMNNMAFETEVNGHKMIIDADESVGGKNLGPRPKPFMLMALAGCTGMDVVAILKKMKVDFEDLSVSVEGDMTEEYPKHYKSMHVVYTVKGKDISYDKVKKAVELSEEKYCGVSAVYKKAIELSSEIKIIET